MAESKPPLIPLHGCQAPHRLENLVPKTSRLYQQILRPENLRWCSLNLPAAPPILLEFLVAQIPFNEKDAPGPVLEQVNRKTKIGQSSTFTMLCEGYVEPMKLEEDEFYVNCIYAGGMLHQRK